MSSIVCQLVLFCVIQTKTAAVFLNTRLIYLKEVVTNVAIYLVDNVLMIARCPGYTITTELCCFQ